MLSRDAWIQLTAAAVLILCIAGAGWLVAASSALAGRAQLTYADQAAEGDPPEVALGIAMGAFRGLFVNFLWIRANRLKEEGKYYEAMQLSSAITRLQPRFPRVWVFHAWNMAYNISVATQTAEERWQWVRAGVDLLRSKAIPRNPNDTMLHKELAWIFNHKVQGFADDANHYYKRQLAREWAIILGPPPRRDGTREQNTERMVEFLRPIVDSPDTLEGVIAREIADRMAAAEITDPAQAPPSMVRELADRIRTEARLPLGREVLRFFRLRLAALDSWYLREQSMDLPRADRSDVIDSLMLDDKYVDAWRRLTAFIARRIIIDEMFMEPERMLRYTRKYGPLDWRHPSTHAIYWTSRGVEEGLERQSTTDFDTINTDRVTMHAIQELFRFGNVQYDLTTDEYFALTNFDWVDTYAEIIEEVSARGGIAADVEQRAYRTYGAGYENFMRDAIRAAFNRGDYALAERLHRRLRNWGGLNINDPNLPEDLKLPLAEFVMFDFQERIATPHVAATEIQNAVFDAFLVGLGQSRPEIFKRQMEYAKLVRDEYMKVQGIQTLADARTNRMGEFVAANLAEFTARIVSGILSGESNISIGLMQAGQIYRRTPVQIQRLIYDNLRADVRRGRPWIPEEQISVIFPEPPGMEEFRAQMAALDEETRARRQIQFLQQ